MIAAATVPVIEKHGIDAILSPLIRDLQIWDKERFTVHVDGIADKTDLNLG